MDIAPLRTQMVLIGVAVVLGAVAPHARAETFTISTSYNNLLSNPGHTGMLDVLMVEAIGRIGMECELVFTETDRSLVDVNAGIFDAEINRIAGMEQTYPNLVQVPEPNMTMRFVAFVNRAIEIDGWESIRNLNVGLVRGWKILEAATEGFPYVTRVPTEVELFSMLRLDRIDVALYSELTGRAAVSEYGADYRSIRPLAPPLAERDMFLYVHRSRADVAPEIAAALAAMKTDGTYDRIVAEALASLE